MIPLKDYNPTRHFPIVTVLLIAINVIAFLQDRLTGHYEPMLVETARGIVRINHFVGGLSARFSLVPAQLAAHPADTWYNVFTSMFLHGNWLHIGSNMLYLWIFGNNIEDSLGRFKFIVFYFCCGMAAAATQFLSAPGSSVPMVGASGAVAGVMGAYLILYPHARILTLLPIFIFFTFIEVPAFVIIGYWALLQFISANWINSGSAQQGGIAYFAHIGGFTAGIILLFLLGGRPSARRQDFR
ncbi:MAG: rhomboid family intramembrane serine protease [Geobacteraceae bacterium]|nr:rhomboid family intramembrane serine protease [Geobacteraceae bacterium]